MLARGELRTIGATTMEEYHKYLEKDSALGASLPTDQGGRADDRRDHPDSSTACGRSTRRTTALPVRRSALVSAASLAGRYIADRHPPDKAIDLIDEAGSRMRISRRPPTPELEEIEKKVAAIHKDKEGAVAVAAIRERPAQLRDRNGPSSQSAPDDFESRLGETEGSSGVDHRRGADRRGAGPVDRDPVQSLTEAETAKLLRMEDGLRNRIVGQHEAIQASEPLDPPHPRRSSRTPSVRRVRSSSWALGLWERPRPPRRSRSSCSARTTPRSTSTCPSTWRSTRSAAWWVQPRVRRLRRGRTTTEAVRNKPFSMVLFDEIEKAHPDVFNTLLQILGTGVSPTMPRKGRTVDFKNTAVIIMTSKPRHPGSEAQGVGFARDSEAITYEKIKRKRKVTEALKKQFRPEFLNRTSTGDRVPRLTLDEVNSRSFDLMIFSTGFDSSSGSRRRSTSSSQVPRRSLATKGYEPQMGLWPLCAVIHPAGCLKTRSPKVNALRRVHRPLILVEIPTPTTLRSWCSRRSPLPISPKWSWRPAKR